MKIHLLDTDKRPTDRSIISANCGMKIKFIPECADPECADIDGLKICKNCLIVHNSLLKGVSEIYTFALKNEKEEERKNGNQGNK